jgi:hypothetical protein
MPGRGLQRLKMMKTQPERQCEHADSVVPVVVPPKFDGSVLDQLPQVLEEIEYELGLSGRDVVQSSMGLPW